MPEVTLEREVGVVVRSTVPIPIALWRRARAVTGPRQLQSLILEGLEKRVAELEADGAKEKEQPE